MIQKVNKIDLHGVNKSHYKRQKCDGSWDTHHYMDTRTGFETYEGYRPTPTVEEEVSNVELKVLLDGVGRSIEVYFNTDGQKNVLSSEYEVENEDVMNADYVDILDDIKYINKHNDIAGARKLWKNLKDKNFQ